MGVEINTLQAEKGGRRPYEGERSYPKPEPRSCTWITKFLLFSAPVVIVEFQYNKYQNYIVIEVY